MSKTVNLVKGAELNADIVNILNQVFEQTKYQNEKLEMSEDGSYNIVNEHDWQNDQERQSHFIALTYLAFQFLGKQYKVQKLKNDELNYQYSKMVKETIKKEINYETEIAKLTSRVNSLTAILEVQKEEMNKMIHDKAVLEANKENIDFAKSVVEEQKTAIEKQPEMEQPKPKTIAEARKEVFSRQGRSKRSEELKLSKPVSKNMDTAEKKLLKPAASLKNNNFVDEVEKMNNEVIATRQAQNRSTRTKRTKKVEKPVEEKTIEEVKQVVQSRYMQVSKPNKEIMEFIKTYSVS